MCEVAKASGKRYYKVVLLAPLEHLAIMIYKEHRGAFPLVTGEHYVNTARCPCILSHTSMDTYQVRESGRTSVLHSRSAKL